MFDFLKSLGSFVPLISGGLQAVSSLMAYRQQKDADAAALAQARIEAAKERADTERAALEEERQAKTHAKAQAMMFLKSGVSLEGSPLLVMEETRQKGIENARNVKNTGYARAQSIMREGSIKRASLMNSGLQAAEGMLGGWTNYQILKKQLG